MSTRRSLQNQPQIFSDELENPIEDEFGPEIIPDESDESGNETEESQHDTESEMSEDSDVEDEEDEEDENSIGPYLLGKDGMTLWNKEVPNQRVRATAHNNFIPGINRMPKVTTELESFFLFFDKSVFDRIVQQTNSFIAHIAPTISYRRTSVRPTDVEEMHVFIGLLFLIGSLKSSRSGIKHLWNTDEGIGFDICRCAMSFNRFSFLMR